jgi:hypothetical protein
MAEIDDKTSISLMFKLACFYMHEALTRLSIPPMVSAFMSMMMNLPIA